MKQQETIYRLMDNTTIGKFPGPMDEHITEREKYRIYDRKKRKDNNSNQNFYFQSNKFTKNQVFICQRYVL